jgi:hypothetical protein
MPKKQDEPTSALVPASVQGVINTEIIKKEQAQISELSQLMTVAGFPREAIPAFLMSAQSRASLFNCIEQQRRLPDNERSALLKVKPGTYIDKKTLKMIDQFVNIANVPYDTVSIISGRPYAGVDGRKWRLDADPRLKKSITFRNLNVHEESQDPWAQIDVVIEFWNGEHYDGHGICTLSGAKMQAGASANLERVVNMARTRAFGDACRKALGEGLGSMPEEMDSDSMPQRTPKITVEKVEPKVDPTATNTEPPFSDKTVCFKKVREQFGLLPNQVLSALGGRTAAQVTQEEIWNKAKEIATKAAS